MKRSALHSIILLATVCALLLALPVAAQESCGPTVVVAPGDNLFRIAQRCGVTLDALRAANPQVTDPSRLFVGTVLIIPSAQPQPTLPPLTPATVAIFPAGGPPGSTVSVIANGLPANAPVVVGFGPLGAPPIITSSATSGAYGELQAQTNVAPGVLPGSAPWVITLTVGGQAAGTSLPFTIANAPGPTPPPPSGALFDRALIYLIAPNDNGASGDLIGCMDSVIPVEVQFAPTVAPMTAAYQSLLSVAAGDYGQSGLVNTLGASSLTLQGVNIQNRQAIVQLSGTLSIAGVCDVPRIQAQLERVALQFNTVDSVQVFINGQPLATALGTGQG